MLRDNHVTLRGHISPDRGNAVSEICRAMISIGVNIIVSLVI